MKSKGLFYGLTPLVGVPKRDRYNYSMQDSPIRLGGKIGRVFHQNPILGETYDDIPAKDWYARYRQGTRAAAKFVVDWGGLNCDSFFE